MANEKGLHLVELKTEREDFPKVIASPPKCRTANEIQPNEILDFSQVNSIKLTKTCTRKGK